jgi:hypothetical protein
VEEETIIVYRIFISFLVLVIVKNYRGGINAASSQDKPGKPGLQENEILLFSIYLDLSGFTYIGVQLFCRVVVLLALRRRETDITLFWYYSYFFYFDGVIRKQRLHQGRER